LIQLDGQYFNSSMVRLKDNFIFPYKPWWEPFQFLNGSIKSRCQLDQAVIYPHFNSSMVRLKVLKEGNIYCPIKYFNSSMVRLKALACTCATVLCTKFQFLNGSIKRILHILPDKHKKNFNSSMVRLKVTSIFHQKYQLFHFNSSMVRLKVVSAKVVG